MGFIRACWGDFHIGSYNRYFVALSDTVISKIRGDCRMYAIAFTQELGVCSQ